MRVLADLHHEDLFRSLLMLSARLGATLYRPIGGCWFKRGLWQIHSHPDTVKQYLGDETYHGYKGVTFEEAADTKWDFVIATHCNHIQPWMKFFKNKCTVILQVGNNWNYNHECFRGVKHVLNSTSTQWPNAVNHVRYHPEFELPKATEKKDRSVYSFLHYPSKDGQALFKKLGKLLPGWDFRMYGAGSELGALTSQEDVIRLAAEASFLFQFKPGGDGYGFNIHRAWASNTPVIMDYNHYADKMAAMCMVDGVSSFDLNLGVERVAEMIQRNASGITPSEIWRHNCDPDRQWEERLKPFFEQALNS